MEKPPKRIIKTLKDLEKVLEIANKHNVTHLSVDGVGISLREKPVQAAQPQPTRRQEAEIDDETLFWSAQQ